MIIKDLTLFDLIFHPVKCLGFGPIIFYGVLVSYQGFWHLEEDYFCVINKI